MTQEQINELRRLAQAATPGPWAYTKDSKDFPVNGYVTVRDCIYSVCVLPYEGIRADNRVTANGLFIAAANPAAILALIQQRDELLAALNSAASVSHSGGLCGYAEDDALRLVRVITLPYWDKSASDDKHREAIAKAEAQS